MIRVRYAFEVAGALLMITMFCVLPRAWAHSLGRRLGRRAYLLSKRSRRVAIENLAKLLPSVRVQPEKGTRIPIGILRGWMSLPLEPRADP